MGVLRRTSPIEMPIQRNARKRDMSRSAMIRPPIIASTRVAAEMIKVICSPDIRKSKLPHTVSQRNWYLNNLSSLLGARHFVGLLIFRTAGVPPAHGHEAGGTRPRSLEHEKSATEWRAPSDECYGATIGSSLWFLAYFISRPSSLMVSTNRLMLFSQ